MGLEEGHGGRVVGVLAGRAALITGANRGLGLEIARAYLAEGASLFLCARDGDLLKRAVEGLRVEYPGGQTQFATGDVSCEADVERVTRLALERFPQLDILVNNAGVYGPMGLLEDVDWRAWTEAMAINVYGSVLMIRGLLPHLKARGYGKIIQLSGGGATNPLPRISAYAASKAAIVRLIETVAEECRTDGIDANSIAPGALNTGMLSEVLAAGPQAVGEDFYERAIKQEASGGAGPSKGAALAVFLASRASDGVTGRLISALWDRYEAWPGQREALDKSDAYTLRRIIGRDRGLEWGDR